MYPGIGIGIGSCIGWPKISGIGMGIGWSQISGIVIGIGGHQSSGIGIGVGWIFGIGTSLAETHDKYWKPMGYPIKMIKVKMFSLARFISGFNYARHTLLGVLSRFTTSVSIVRSCIKS